MVASTKSSNIIHDSGTNPGICVVVLVEITECATTCKARNGCIRATELYGTSLEYRKMSPRQTKYSQQLDA